MNIACVINYILKNSSLVYEFPQDGTDLLKHLAVVKDNTFKILAIIQLNAQNLVL